MSATTDPAASVESRESVRRRRAARPRGAKQLDSTALIYLVLVGVIIVSTVLTALEGRNFFSQGNIWAVLAAMSVLGLISIGQTLVILVGSLDLSVPYVVSLATVVAAGGMKGLDGQHPRRGLSTPSPCARWSASRWGCWSASSHVHGFIASLGVGLIVSGYLATNYQGSHGFCGARPEAAGAAAGSSGWIPTGVPRPARLCSPGDAACCATPGWVTTSTPSAATATSPACRGMRTVLPVVAAHVLCSVLVGLAALLLLSRTGVGSPTIGSQGRYDLLSIAAVVLGGTLLAGGKGNVVGTLGGAAIFAVLDNVMGVMQVNPFLKDFIRGLVIVLAVAVYARRSIVRRPPRFGHGSRRSCPSPNRPEGGDA